MRKLYLKEKKRGKLQSLESFLRSFYTDGWFPATYVDKQYTLTNCGSGSSRSLEDILAVLRSQYKSVPVKKVVEILLDIAKNPTEEMDECGNVDRFSYSWIYCDDIDKWVFSDFFGRHLDGMAYNYNDSVTEEYDCSGEGEYSLLDIVSYIGYTEVDIKFEIGRILEEEDENEEMDW